MSGSPAKTGAVFIAGAHTDVGKTHVACGLIAAARARGLSVDALKPVASGFDPRDWTASDPGRLLAALGRPLTSSALELMAPWRFTAPLAPPMAARLEGRALGLAAMADACARRIAATPADLFLVEGAGGLMSPLADDGLNIDLIAALDLPVVLVGGAYLGAISHTLTAIDVLKNRGHQVRAVALSESADPAAPDFAETVALTARYAGRVPVLPVPRAPNLSSHDADWAKAVLAHLV